MTRIFSALFTLDNGGAGVAVDEGRSQHGDWGYEVGEIEVSGSFTEYLGFFLDEADARKEAADRLEILAARVCDELRTFDPENCICE